ncbi:hypothetical protein AMTR_s00024p00249750 [Amborella trichopoda]|uniref:Uncharacterized protein n=1 Tax=Amborella trichopoda TaxID=13333 RepID=W1PVL6_AMBTC|nr:hypothetical protein AMTR_s00024p00249750 [Amborella trichopoda]
MHFFNELLGYGGISCETLQASYKPPMEREETSAKKHAKRSGKRLWSHEEDLRLIRHIEAYGKGSWTTLPQKAGLNRNSKSCRLRWMNYLRPDIKHGNFSPEEDDLILRLHRLVENRWSLIAGRVPGRTDSQIKNFWNTRYRGKKHIYSSFITI